MDPVEALQRLGGVATYGELMGPTTRADLVRAVKSDRVVKLRRNRYALVDTDREVQQAVGLGATLSHLSAAQYYGWKVKFPPLRPTITLPRSGRKPAADVETHWATLVDRDMHRHVTTRVRTVIDCARAYDFDVALCVVDSALREGLVTPDELELAALGSARTGRAKALRVVQAGNAKAANPFETCLRAIVMTVPGLEFEVQGKVPGVGWVDILGRALGLVIEAESFEHHGTRRGLSRDVARYTKCARRGLVVVRFTWEDVMFSPDEVRDALVDVVEWRIRQAVGGHALRSPA